MNPPETDGSGWRLVTPLRLVAAMWLVGFTVYFFSQGLPNASFTRPAFWRETPWLILDSLLPPVADPGQMAPTSSGWKHLPQRFGNMFWAAMIVAGSWHLGALILRIAMRRGDATSAAPMTPGTFFCMAGLLGLSAWSLIVLATGLAGELARAGFVALLCGCIALDWIWERRRPWRPRILRSAGSLLDGVPRLALVCLAAMAPFLLAMALGSLLPSTDFDVKEYHLEGPKEWYLSGRITFLPYNVYTSFPFLTEMLLLSAMVLRGDWFEGGIAGQLVLASFGAYAAIAVFQIADRFSRRAAWLAAFIYLTTPWVTRISIIAYVEGALAAYLAAALLAFLELRRDRPNAVHWTQLCGFFAGSAASCKYPGVISAVIPCGCLVICDGFASSAGARIRTALSRATLFSLCGLLAFGPWLLKNLVQTGNPVYPLLWDVFHGGDFDAALNAKFKAGHPLPVNVLKDPPQWFPDLWRHVWDVAVGSDWQSPLMFGLAPAAVFVWWSFRRNRRENDSKLAGDLAVILLDAAWLFLTWWALTHRIDRFWVPMLPILGALSGITLDWILNGATHFAGPLAGRERATKLPISLAVIATLAAVTWYHLAFIASPLIGFNGYLMDETVARRIAETPGMTIINGLPGDSRTLLVGEAQVFEARRPVIYSTVFNHNVFEQWFADRSPEGTAPRMRPVDELRQQLDGHGVTHILVNWNEVLRYRTTYGYTDFVTPENVDRLEELGLVERVLLPEQGFRQKVADKGDSTRFQLSEWGKRLVRQSPDGDWYPAYELWRVVR